MLEPEVEPEPVTVPFAVAAVAIPSNLVIWVDVAYPLTDAVAAAIEIAGVAPQLDTTGAVPVTEVTSLPVIPLIFVLSAADKEPGALVVAALMLIAGVLPPYETIGALPVTPVTPALSPVFVPLVFPITVRFASVTYRLLAESAIFAVVSVTAPVKLLTDKTVSVGVSNSDQLPKVEAGDVFSMYDLF